MRKARKGGGFPVEMIGRAIMNCQVVRALTAKTRAYLTGVEAGRMRTLCIVLIAGMLLGNIVLLFRAGKPSRASPQCPVIRPVVTAGAERRPTAAKAFGQAWDSLMADPATKKQWDSLLRLRPGLRDTLGQLKRMDSAFR